MNPAPKAFRSELRAHNFHALGGALLSAVAAFVAWNLAYFFFVLILFGLVTAMNGDLAPGTPPWIPRAALAGAAFLFVWGLADAAHRRFAPPSDRAIIGWHLVGDFALLPVRLTFAIGGNLSAVRRLGAEDRDRAWALLTAIYEGGRSRAGELAFVEPEPARRRHLLGVLQLLGYIDLHRGDEDWFYTVCSAREPELRALTAG